MISKDYMIIDVHAHPVEETLKDLHSAEKMIARMNAVNTQKALLAGAIVSFGPDPTPDEVRQVNLNTFKLCRQFPESFLGYCYLNALHDGDFLETELNRCLKNGTCAGIKLWVSVNARDEKIHTVMDLAQEYSLPVLIHAWYKTVGKVMNESSPADIAVLAQSYPEVPILMAHMTACGNRGMVDIKGYENVSIDTSGSQPYAGALESAIDLLGSERILYGTDMPFRDPAAQLSRIIDAPIPEQIKENILYRNALQFFHLQ